MRFYSYPINSTDPNVTISQSFFEDIFHDNQGGAIFLYNQEALITSSRFFLCQSFTAAAIFANKSTLSVSLCCFEKLSVTDIGNAKAGTIIDFINSNLDIDKYACYLCALQQNMSGDSPFVARYSASSFNELNVSKCDSFGGSSIVGLLTPNQDHSDVNRCFIDTCIVDILCEHITTTKSSIFLNNTVIYFGYQGTIFESCFFQDNHNIADKGEVTYTDCSGEFPKCSYPLSTKKPILQVIDRDICLLERCSDGAAMMSKQSTVIVLLLSINFHFLQLEGTPSQPKSDINGDG